MSIGVGCCGFEHSVQIGVERFGLGGEGEKKNDEAYGSIHHARNDKRRWSWPGLIRSLRVSTKSLMHHSDWVSWY